MPDVNAALLTSAHAAGVIEGEAVDVELAVSKVGLPVGEAVCVRELGMLPVWLRVGEKERGTEKEAVSEMDAVLEAVTDAEAVLEDVTDAEAVLEGVTDAVAVLEGVTDAVGVLEGVTDAVGVLEGVTVAEAVMEGVTAVPKTSISSMHAPSKARMRKPVMSVGCIEYMRRRAAASLDA